MKAHRAFLFTLLLCVGLCQAGAATRSSASGTTLRDTGVRAAQTVSTVTGMAISPLLGVGAVGAYQWYQARGLPASERPELHWFARPWFWIPALLLAGIVALKDILGTAAPTALKKPFDIAEAIENKVSALVVAGAVIPLVTTVFPETPAQASLATAGFAAIDPAGIGNTLLVPFAILGFLIVWLAAHTINILILLSPFTSLDAALKGFRLLVLALLTGASLANPFLGAGFALAVAIVACLIAGWSFRLLVFGNVYIWDFVTVRRRRFHPLRDGNRMFTARRVDEVPVRTYGWLNRGPEGTLQFEYRPWLILPRRKLALPPGTYVVGRSLFNPSLARVLGEELEPMLSLPPRYQTHEQALSDTYGFGGVRDIGLRKCLKGLLELLGWGRRETAGTT